MVELTQERPMAKKGQHGGKRERAGRPKSSDEGYGAVKMRLSILAKIRQVAAYRGVPVAVVVSELIDGPAERAYVQMYKDMGKQIEDKD